MSTKVSSHELQQLKAKVYQAARDGRALSIFAMLWNLDRETVVNAVNIHRRLSDYAQYYIDNQRLNKKKHILT